MPPKQKDPPTALPPDPISDQIVQINQTITDHTNLVNNFETRLTELTNRLDTMTTTQNSILQSNQAINQQFITFQDNIQRDHESINNNIDTKLDSIIQLFNQQNSTPDTTTSSPSLHPQPTTMHRFQHAYNIMQQQMSSSHSPSTTTITTTPNSSRLTGFHQKESKDFHVSKFIKLLQDDILNSDSLQDLELFFDGILSHLNTIAITSNLFPSYQDLDTTFDFRTHLQTTFQTANLTLSDYNQGMINYTTFGTGLRKYLLDPKTIPSTTCPESAVQLMSPRDERDGFILLKSFIFRRSPQLDGIYKDFSSSISSLSITTGEHIQSFYCRTLWIHNELKLAKFADGSLAQLHEKFLALLRATGCSLIIGLTNTHWQAIRNHRRNPTNLNKTLPWSLTDIVTCLESAGTTTLNNPSSHLPINDSPYVASATMDNFESGTEPTIDPFAAYSRHKGTSHPSSRFRSSPTHHPSSHNKHFIPHNNHSTHPHKQNSIQRYHNNTIHN
jgi:hypothetical protein